MNNQRRFLQQSFNLTNLSSIFALYFYSLGSMFLGYAVYLIYTLNSVDSPTNWVGESLFWGVIVFFLSIFILFLPVEFFNKSRIQNSGFNQMIVNIIKETMSTSGVRGMRFHSGRHLTAKWNLPK